MKLDMVMKPILPVRASRNRQINPEKIDFDGESETRKKPESFFDVVLEQGG